MSYLYWLDEYTDVIQHFIASKLVLAPLLLLFIEEAGIPIIVPGDAIIAYTGYKLSSTPGSPELWQAFVMAQISVIGGSTILFFLSKRWGQMLIHKLGKYVFLKEKHIKRAEDLFAKYGALAIIFGRHIPGLRIPITFFAATSGVRYRTFIVCTFISTSLWILFYLSVGRKLGADFHDQFQKYMGISFGVMAALTLGVVILHLIGLYRERRRSRTDS